MKFKKPVKKTKKSYAFRKKLMIRIKPNYEFYFFLLPIAIPIIIRDKIKNNRYNKLEWNEKRAERILNATLPKVLCFDEDGPNCYYSLGLRSTAIADRAPKLDRTWAKKFSIKIIDYLKEKYENEDYTKKIEYDGYEEWIVFTEKEK